MEELKKVGDHINDQSRNASEGGAKLPRETVREVGRKLRASYQQIIDQPVPNRLLELLQRLEQEGGASRADLQNDGDRRTTASKLAGSRSNGGRN